MAKILAKIRTLRLIIRQIRKIGGMPQLKIKKALQKVDRDRKFDNFTGT
jgi:hypothetical protein